jgi:hypothetical protein
MWGTGAGLATSFWNLNSGPTERCAYRSIFLESTSQLQSASESAGSLIKRLLSSIEPYLLPGNRKTPRVKTIHSLFSDTAAVRQQLPVQERHYDQEGVLCQPGCAGRGPTHCGGQRGGTTRGENILVCLALPLHGGNSCVRPPQHFSVQPSFFSTRLARLQIVKEDDSSWPAPDQVGRQELEIVIGNEHISFATTKLGSLLQVQSSDDPEGLRVFYYLVQDLKCLVFSLISAHFKIQPIAR